MRHRRETKRKGGGLNDRECKKNDTGKIWQLPTLPRLKPKYHWRRKVSRPSSGRDRVGPFRNSHQIISVSYGLKKGRIY